MAELSAKSQIDPHRRAWLLLGLLLASYVVFDALVDLLYQALDASVRDWAIATIVGAIFAQPVLMAIWGAFGPEPSKLRIPLTIGGFAIVLLTSFLVSRIDRQLSIAMAVQSPRLLLSLTVFFVVALSVLGLVALVTRWRICHTSSMSQVYSPTNQFSIRYLLGLTAGCAVLLAVGRVVVKLILQAGVTLPATSIPVFALECGLLLLMILCGIVFPMVVLAPRPGWPLILAMLVASLFLSFVSVEAILMAYPLPSAEITLRALLIELGVACSALFSAIVVRLAGYRLIRRSWKTAGAPESPRLP